MFDDLYQIIIDRKAKPDEKSYTSRLMRSGEDEILKKVGEEAMEVILAAKGQGNERVVEEVADLFYHVFVLLAYRDLTPQDVQDELRRRHQSRQPS